MRSLAAIQNPGNMKQMGTLSTAAAQCHVGMPAKYYWRHVAQAQCYWKRNSAEVQLIESLVLHWLTCYGIMFAGEQNTQQESPALVACTPVRHRKLHPLPSRPPPPRIQHYRAEMFCLDGNWPSQSNLALSPEENGLSSLPNRLATETLILLSRE